MEAKLSSVDDGDDGDDDRKPGPAWPGSGTKSPDLGKVRMKKWQTLQ